MNAGSAWRFLQRGDRRRQTAVSQCPEKTKVRIGSTRAWIRRSRACTSPTASTPCRTKRFVVLMSGEEASVRGCCCRHYNAAAAPNHPVEPALIERLEEDEDGSRS